MGCVKPLGNLDVHGMCRPGRTSACRWGIVLVMGRLRGSRTRDPVAGGLSFGHAPTCPVAVGCQRGAQDALLPDVKEELKMLCCQMIGVV